MLTAVRPENADRVRPLIVLAGVRQLLRAIWTGALIAFVLTALGASVLSSRGLFLGAGAAVDMATGGAIAVVAFLTAWLTNGDVFGDPPGAEMRIRAWVLLEHLDLWRGWNADRRSPFYNKVDMTSVALIGHSRGGEAAAVAAAMASDDPASRPLLAPFPTGLAVRAVVAIAPCDGQIEGAGEGSNRLKDVDYLTIQGGQDADMAWWSGIRQFARTDVAGTDHFKAGVWVRRANHGRFNATWNLGDAGLNADWLIDQASLLTMEQQQDVAKTTVAGFLEASLLGRDGYRDMFAVPALGRDWLPDDSYVTRLVEGSTSLLADADLPWATALTPGATTRLAKQDLVTREIGVTQLNRAVKVTWTGTTGLAVLGLPAGAVPMTRNASLRFGIATASLDPADPSPAVTIELVDSAGRVAVVDLASYGGVFPAMPSALFKSQEVARLAMLDGMIDDDAETHLQTFALPVAAFAATSPSFDATRVRDVRFRFAGPTNDGIYLDEVGFDPD